MKKITVILFFAAMVWLLPQTSLAIGLTAKDLTSTVQITSYSPKETIDFQIRSLAGLYSDDELAGYRKQLEEQHQVASGLMVTYSGCALTNKHAVYDQDTGGTHPKIHLWKTVDFLKPLEDLGEAVLVWRSTMLDIALVCLNDTQGQFYQHIRFNPENYKDFELALGDAVYNLGYPVSANSTLTLTSGIVAGVWDENFIKSDLAITGGASGSPIYDKDGKVFSLAAGNAGDNAQYGLFLKPSYVYNWRGLYNQTYREVITDAAGCLDGKEFGIYTKKGQEYYDLSCKIKRDPGLEKKLAFEYKKSCNAEFNNDELIEASYYLKSEKSGLHNWLKYLETSCYQKESSPAVVFSAKTE